MGRRTSSLVLTFLLVAVACEAGLLNVQEIERAVRQDVLAQTGVETNVDCPTNISLESGAVFVCQAEDSNGFTIPVDVTQTNDRGDVTWELSVHNIEELEAEVGEIAGEQLEAAVTADCPAALLPVTERSVIRCRATRNSGQTDPLRVVVNGPEVTVRVL